MNYESTKEELLKNDKEFRRLFREHQECEGRLEELATVDDNSEEYAAQIKPIKLHKLALKDRMENIIRTHATAS